MPEKHRVLPSLTGEEAINYINGKIYEYGSCRIWRRHMRAQMRVNKLYDAFEAGEFDRAELEIQVRRVCQLLQGTHNTAWLAIKQRDNKH